MNNRDKAKKIGKLVATNFYSDFIKHPEYIGPNWNWDKFPEYAEKHATVSCFMEFPYKVRNLKQLKVICGESAKLEAIELLKTKRHLAS